MPKYKNYLEVDKIKEPNLLRICKDLEIQGKSIIQEHNNELDRWCSLSRTIGVRGKPLIQKKLLLPPLRSSNIQHRNMGVINTYPGVQIKHKKIGNNKIRFHFFKKK